MSKPSCGQCLRAGAQCTGFRDLRSFGFRDQSAEVMRKARTSRPSSNRPASANLSLSQQEMGSLSGKQPAHNPYLNIPVAFRDQAMQFFFHHYLLNESTLSCDPPGCFTIIYSQAPAYGYLSNAVDAVGMASLANLRHAPHLRHAACEKYSLVLRKIRRALEDSEQVMSDQLLVAVMLLALYEVSDVRLGST